MAFGSLGFWSIREIAEAYQTKLLNKTLNYNTGFQKAKRTHVRRGKCGIFLLCTQDVITDNILFIESLS